VNSTDRYEVSSANIVHETIEGEVVIVNLDNGRYYSAKGLGHVVWDFLKSGGTHGELLDALTSQFPDKRKEIERTTAKMIGDLRAEGLMVNSPNGAGAHESMQLTREKVGAVFDPPMLTRHPDYEAIGGPPTAKPAKEEVDVPFGRYAVGNPNIVSETIDGETVIVNLENGYYYSTDRLGSVFWNLLQSGLAYQEVIEMLIDRYPEDGDEIEHSFAQMLSNLQNEGLMVKAREGGAVASPQRPVDPFGNLDFTPPLLVKHDDMEDLLLVDPIHDVEDSGWPNRK